MRELSKVEIENYAKTDRLREIMVEFGIKSYSELAKRIGVAQSFMSDIINGKKQVPKTLGAKLEDRLGVSRKWFETGEGQLSLDAQDIPEVKPENLKKLRVSLKLNQKQFGEKIGYAQNTVSATEVSARVINDRYIDKVCEVFSVNKRFLFYGEMPMFNGSVKGKIKNLIGVKPCNALDHIAELVHDEKFQAIIESLYFFVKEAKKGGQGEGKI